MTAFQVAVLYKVVALAIGLAFAFMGYRLFTLGIFGRAGELETVWKDARVLVRRAAPGTFFALFGCFIAGFTILRGIEYTEEQSASGAAFDKALIGAVLPAIQRPELDVIDKVLAGEDMTENEKTLLRQFVGTERKKQHFIAELHEEEEKRGDIRFQPEEAEGG